MRPSPIKVPLGPFILMEVAQVSAMWLVFEKGKNLCTTYCCRDVQRPHCTNEPYAPTEAKVSV